MCWTIWTKVFYLVGYVSLFVLKYTIVTQSHGLSHVRDSSRVLSTTSKGGDFSGLFLLDIAKILYAFLAAGKPFHLIKRDGHRFRTTMYKQVTYSGLLLLLLLCNTMSTLTFIDIHQPGNEKKKRNKK